MTAEPRRITIDVRWAALFKVVVVAAMVWLWLRIVWVVLLLTIAVIIAVGLAPVVAWFERRGVARWVAAVGVVIAIVGTLAGFLVLTWSSLSAQAANLGTQLAGLEQTILQHAPAPVLDILRRSNEKADASMVAPYALAIGRGVLTAAAAFVLAWILVVYLLLEAETTYRWIRGFVPARRRARFDRTAAEARDVAYGFVIGNTTTSTCAGIYFFAWLQILGVPGALLLALLAFVFDFIPVLGFYLSVIPAMAMAATKSSTLALAMIPIYMSYDLIENYLIGPRVYAGRLKLSKLAILLAFAVGGELGGVIGAVLALPVAAIYPTIERLWLRGSLGDDVVDEHTALTTDE